MSSRQTRRRIGPPASLEGALWAMAVAAGVAVVVPMMNGGWVGLPGVPIAAVAGYVATERVTRASLPVALALGLLVGIGAFIAAVVPFLVVWARATVLLLPEAVSSVLPIVLGAAIVWALAIRARALPWGSRSWVEAGVLGFAGIGFGAAITTSYGTTTTLTADGACVRIPDATYARVVWSPDGAWLGIWSLPAFGGGATLRVLERDTLRLTSVASWDDVDGEFAVGPDGTVVWLEPSRGTPFDSYDIRSASPTSAPHVLGRVVSTARAIWWGEQGLVVRDGTGLAAVDPAGAVGTDGTLPRTSVVGDGDPLGPTGWWAEVTTDDPAATRWSIGGGGATFVVTTPDYYRDLVLMPDRSAVAYPRYDPAGWFLTRVPLDGGAPSVIDSRSMDRVAMARTGDLAWANAPEVCIGRPNAV